MKILTFDVEDWFHILANESTENEKEWGSFESRIHQNMERIFGLLEQKKTKATFFCLGWIAQKYPDIVKQIDSLGYEVATHSSAHQLVYAQSRDEFEEDLKRAIQSVENKTGKKVRAYRAPGFSVNDATKWVFEILLQQGIEIDCSIFPKKRRVGGFAEFGVSTPSILSVNGRLLKEFPMNSFKFFKFTLAFSGGGYFRVLPYWVTKTLTKRTNYTMTYFHPRDFDKGQPVVEGLPIVRRFNSYYGLGSSFRKLEKFLDDFDFVDLETADSLVEWDKVEQVVI